VLLGGFLVLNVLAYQHARALTRWAAAGPRTPPPRRLPLAQKLGVLVVGARIPKPTNDRTPGEVGLRYERHLFPSLDRVALETWVVPHPRPRGLAVLFHGYADSKASVLPQAEVLHGLGLSLMLVDFRGSGGSAGDATSIGFHEAQDVVAATRYAADLPGDEPLVLFGGSMGAAAVLKAVAEHRLAPAALILECPFDTLRHTVARRFRSAGVPAFPAADLLVFWGGVQQGFNGFRHNPVAYAAGVRVPTLVFHGERDDTVSLDEARSVVDRLAGPKRLVIVPGAGHGGFLRARRREWREAVASFLAGSGLPVVESAPGP
jgi:hypothetical protein